MLWGLSVWDRVSAKVLVGPTWGAGRDYAPRCCLATLEPKVMPSHVLLSSQDCAQVLEQAEWVMVAPHVLWILSSWFCRTKPRSVCISVLRGQSCHARSPQTAEPPFSPEPVWVFFFFFFITYTWPGKHPSDALENQALSKGRLPESAHPAPTPWGLLSKRELRIWGHSVGVSENQTRVLVMWMSTNSQKSEVTCYQARLQSYTSDPVHVHRSHIRWILPHRD